MPGATWHSAPAPVGCANGHMPCAFVGGNAAPGWPDSKTVGKSTVKTPAMAQSIHRPGGNFRAHHGELEAWNHEWPSRIRRGPCKFSGARPCAKHQPQRVEVVRGFGFIAKVFAVATCCGWSCGHSRAPLVSVSPRC